MIFKLPRSVSMQILNLVCLNMFEGAMRGFVYLMDLCNPQIGVINELVRVLDIR